jgi:polyphenol oxidase
MPLIWTDMKELRAAFITREIENDGTRFVSVTNHEHANDALKALDNNSRIASEYFGIAGLEFCMARQVHGSQVLNVVTPGIAGDADGLVTDKPGLALGVLVADCAALLFADPVNRIVAAVHAGWRGAVDGIIPEAVRQMEKIGAEPDLIRAYVSPCISRDVFEIGEEVACRFPDQFVDRTRDRPPADLRGFILHEIQKSGIHESSVTRDDSCTVRNERILHSHRRDGQKSGRMLAVICLSEK